MARKNQYLCSMEIMLKKFCKKYKLPEKSLFENGIHQKVFDNGKVPHIPPVFRVFLFPFGAGIAKPPFPVPPCGAGDFFFLQPSADIVRTMTV